MVVEDYGQNSATDLANKCFNYLINRFNFRDYESRKPEDL